MKKEDIQRALLDSGIPVTKEHIAVGYFFEKIKFDIYNAFTAGYTMGRVMEHEFPSIIGLKTEQGNEDAIIYQQFVDSVTPYMESIYVDNPTQ